MSAEEHLLLLRRPCSAISSSILAQMGSTSACSSAAMPLHRLRSRGSFSHPPHEVVFAHVGGVDHRLVRRAAARSAEQLRAPPACSAKLRAVFPRPDAPSAPLEDTPPRAGDFLSALGGLLAALSMRRSTISMSERISSRSMVSMSRAGSMLPSTWTMSSSSKQRTTWTMASHLPDVGEELVAQALALGRAACTRPAMSTNSMTAGVYLVRVVHLRQLVQPLVRHRHHARHSARWCRTGSLPTAPPRL